jgi:hypothetical protein
MMRRWQMGAPPPRAFRAPPRSIWGKMKPQRAQRTLAVLAAPSPLVGEGWGGGAPAGPGRRAA